MDKIILEVPIYIDVKEISKSILKSKSYKDKNINNQREADYIIPKLFEFFEKENLTIGQVEAVSKYIEKRLKENNERLEKNKPFKVSKY